ncbi:MAG TPA: hypothetical protein VFA39_11815 [Steroidobacteraceae bacterium]|nr:hypothetical protein [Steroidobacteraceae bacterium]
MSRRISALQCALAATLTGIVTSVAFAATSEVPTRYVQFCAAATAAAARADCVHVLEMGSSDARRVLVLVPGHSEAAGIFRGAGRYLSSTLPDTQVWALDRREQNLIDSSHFGRDGELDYYLKSHYRAETDKTASYTRSWGLAMEIAELRRVVLAAGAGGRRVFLGGHSSGANTALAYAAWDFDGVPGYRDLAALVLIDGGTHHAFDGEGYTIHWLTSVGEANDKLANIGKKTSPFTGDLGYVWQVAGAPESVPIDYQLAADYALRDAHGASPLQALLPPAMRPPFRVTNAALLGWLLTTHAPAPDLQLHAGHLDRAGALRDWINDGPADIDEVASIMAQSHPAAFEWYWPWRLSLDITAIDPMVDSPITRRLGLHLAHTKDIDVPLYVFQTGLTHGTVVTAAKWVVANSRIKDHVYVTDASMMHLDPMFDSPGRNAFLRTVADFLRRH